MEYINPAERGALGNIMTAVLQNIKEHKETKSSDPSMDNREMERRAKIPLRNSRSPSPVVVKREKRNTNFRGR